MSEIEVIMNNTAEDKVILVTGGAGFIGSHVSDRLMSRGDSVVIVDEMNDYYDVRQKEANLQYLCDKYGDRVKIYRGDICDVTFISNIFAKEKPTHICHLAARAGVRASIIDPYIYVHSNIEGTTRLLDLARQYACANFVYASSSSVYGCSEKSILSESDAVEKPVSPYAATKKACELLAYTFHHLYGLNCTGLRFFTVYGPRGRPDMAPFKFIDRVFNGQAIQQYGDGSTSRDYTYIDDIVAGVVSAIDTPLGCEVVNLGNGKPYLLRDFISLVETCVGKKANIEVLPEQPGDVERTCADITKAQTLLGYRPQVSFQEGIARTAAWYKLAQSEGLFDDPSDRSRSSSGASSVISASAESDAVLVVDKEMTVMQSTTSDDDVDDSSALGLDLSVPEAPAVPAAAAAAVAVPASVAPAASLAREKVTIPSFLTNLHDHSQAQTVSKVDMLPPSRIRAVRSRSADYPSSSLSPSERAPQEKKRRFGFAREESDLELSSYVEKADRQLKTRTARILHVNFHPTHAGLGNTTGLQQQQMTQQDDIDLDNDIDNDSSHQQTRLRTNEGGLLPRTLSV